MQRVALVAVDDKLRDALVEVADAGVVQLDEPTDRDGAPLSDAAQRLQHLGATRSPGNTADAMLCRTAPDLDALEREGRGNLLAGEAQLQEYSAGAVHRQELAALAGWCPADELAGLGARLNDAGFSVVPMPNPRSADPPSLLGSGGGFAPLVRTYGTVPYRDVDPAMWAGITYVVMFGMMFGDVGHGALLVAGAFVVRMGWIRRLASVRPMWMFVAGAGVAAMAFGALYGEFFGPTGVVPVLWLAPLDEPVRLLLAALAVGVVSLGLAYAVGVVNRWREGGLRLALYASSGIAGAVLFVGVGVVVAGFAIGPTALVPIGAVIALGGLVLAAIGVYTESGRGGTGIAQAVIGGFDLVMRLGSNVVSFTRLAAFGMTHAALGWVVWLGTRTLWANGGWGVAAALLLFVVGNIVAFALEALVAAVQALRLEFYELFSRVFVGEGKPFRPWHIPAAPLEATTC